MGKGYSQEHSDRQGLMDALYSQDRIGWQEFLEGCILILWCEIKDKYFQWLGLQRSRKWWAMALIKKHGWLHGTSRSTKMKYYIRKGWQKPSATFCLLTKKSEENWKQGHPTSPHDNISTFAPHMKSWCAQVWRIEEVGYTMWWQLDNGQNNDRRHIKKIMTIWTHGEW